MKLDDTLPLMLWRAKPDLSCEYTSRAWLEFTGFSAEQAKGDGWSRAVHAEDLARWLDCCVRAFDARDPFEIEYRMRRHDGEYCWVLDRAAPMYSGDGLFLGYVGACVDIHERKRAEQALARSLERERRLRTATEEASRAKDGFVAAMLADVQSPTQAIATWSAHLREQLPSGSEAAEALEAILRSARTQTRIIGNLLDLAQGDSKMPKPEPEAPLLAGVRVLLVEDDAGARDLLLKVLRVAGAEACTAPNSSEALRLLEDWHPDIMLSDMGMSGDDGYVLIRALRALPAERGGCVRAAALTAENEAQVPSRAVAAGYDAQLAKPVEPVALLATVARLVQPARV
ncbi:MAG TPA: PAS domain-containing protein [Burkholderiales bacterium]|nr:PAS domain-containing protein [Burkholderiales bacterium]